jgi:endonuclease/exonuclease/phosphatase family metal-dependent hydrolase
MPVFRIFIFCLLLHVGPALAQLRLCSWNIQNLGKSKSDSEIIFIAGILKDFDVVAIVEVVSGYGGAQSVARLADELNRKGAKWEYAISDATTGTPNKSERYAYLWKTARLQKKNNAWLENRYRDVIEREPFLIELSYRGKLLTVCCFHAITRNKQPETEIKYFKFIEEEYQAQTLLFCGDFNCPESHTVFNPLKSRGYRPVLTGQKTSLKQKSINGECLASEYDNIFYPSQKITFIKSGIVEFYKKFPDLAHARRISDHVPVYFEFDIKN